MRLSGNVLVAGSADRRSPSWRSSRSASSSARAKQKLLPTGTFAFGSPLALLFGVMVLLQMAIISDVFIPLFLQRLHGVGPLVAGYMVALLAVGWSASSMIVAGWTDGRARMLIAGGPMLVLVGAVRPRALRRPRNPGADLTIIVPIGLSPAAHGRRHRLAPGRTLPRASCRPRPTASTT